MSGFGAPKAQGKMAAACGVKCARCGEAIETIQPSPLPMMFSVPCRKCGHRGIYDKQQVRDLSKMKKD